MSEVRAGLVSVILATYNGADRIRPAIESVLDQTYRDLELIVAVDGSTDRTEALLGTMEDPRLVVLALAANQGVNGARNEAIAIAKGEFIAFIDDDDLWLPLKLERQVRLLQGNKDLGIVHTGVIDVYPDGRRLTRLPPRDANSYRGNLIRDCLATSAVVVRRSAFERLGGFKAEAQSSGDWDMWARLIRVYEAASINEPLAITEQRPGSITHGDVGFLARYRGLVLRWRWRDIRAHGLGRKALAYHDAFVGGLLLTASKQGEARRRALRSLRRRPSLRAVTVLMMSFFGQGQVELGWRQLQRLRRVLRA